MKPVANTSREVQSSDYDPGKELNIVLKNRVTTNHILESKRPNVIRFQKENGIQKTNELIQLTIAQCLRLVNVPNLTVDQLKVLANELRHYCKYYTLADIALCIKKGVLGEYGQFFGRIGIDTIMGADGWIKKYEMERAENFEKIKQNEKFAHQKADDNSITFKEFAKKFPDKLKNRKDRTDHKSKISLTYRSLEHYCKVNEIDFENYVKEKIEQWQADYKKEENQLLNESQYMHTMSLIHLAELNKQSEKQSKQAT